jgi:hypothetical protein
MGCEQHLEEILKLSTMLLDLANEERDDCHHDHCLLLDGIMRDCAMQIRKQALQSVLELTNEEDRRQKSDGSEGLSPTDDIGFLPFKRE